MTQPFNKTFFNGKKVFITGHTGFKGSWLAFWLNRLGAEVYGYSLKPPTIPSHYSLLGLDINSTIGDIRNPDKLNTSMHAAKPEIVFHLAAQPLVRLSYEQPMETFSTNVMGTLNVFEASRKIPSVRAIINVTSDKCYENRELKRGYHENDPMGGHDPYSASKGCSELLTKCYRNSYFSNDLYGHKHNVLLASCRAGNVIGGGDWASDRLIPDIMKSANLGKPVQIRNPLSIRPWQHVLEPLSGYLMLGQKLLEGDKFFADAWNFGPLNKNSMSVKDVVRKISRFWDKIDYAIYKSTGNVHETSFLKIDSSKARMKLKWTPKWDASRTLEATARWYRNYYENRIINTEADIIAYEKA
ncbi:MAG: CDP-glucose 4,6-dehydratase [Victivallales bacterium]